MTHTSGRFSTAPRLAACLSAAPCRVALAGFGTVGRSVAGLLAGTTRPAPSELRLTAIFNRQVARKRVDWLPGEVAWTERIEEVIASDADIVVELVGGVDPAGDWVRRALLAGKSVVTANKQLIASRGRELADLAERQGVHLRFEASVCGGVPVLSALRDGLAGDHLLALRGILNGTCNYVLTRMESAGLSFDAALAEAQTQGFAEADPTEDVDGIDARAKLGILCAVALGSPVRAVDIPCRSIRPIEPVDFVYARRLGCAIRQVAFAWRAAAGESPALCAGVQPALVPLASPLAAVQGSQNALLATGRDGGETTFAGRGAGGGPTAVAVMSDLLAIARHREAPRSWLPPGEPAGVRTDFSASHYVRFVVRDRPGIIAELAAVFGRHGIGIDAVLQEPGYAPAELPFVIALDGCAAGKMTRALAEIARLAFHVRPPVCLPILETAEVHAPAM